MTAPAGWPLAAGTAPEAAALVGLVFDTVADLMVLFRRIDGTLRCAAVSGSWVRATGTSPEASLDQPARALLPAAAVDRLEREAGAVGAGDAVTYDELLDLPAGRTELAVTVTGVDTGSGPDTRHYLLWVARDVTEQRRAERELERANAELQRSNADLSAFASVASHDLQEPLRMVSSYVELLARRYEGQLDERADTYIGFAVDGARRMQALISSLLEYARVRSSTPAFAPVDLGAVAADAVHDLAASVEASGADVRIGPLPVVLGDRVLLHRLLQNLIGNAVKFRSDQAPQVTVAAQRAGRGWEITIDDNGPGIAEQDRDRVFEMFARSAAAGSSGRLGTGMGLAVCRGIVERHGGTIAADTSPAGGARIRFTLPDPEESQT